MNIQNHKKKTYDKGLKAEKRAELWLKVKGYKILERRYKTPIGEIDLIVQKNNIIVFVEVKARQTKALALESITFNMRQRIGRAASYYMGHKNLDGCDMRFDVIAVFPSFLGMVTIQHLDNAWQAGS